MGLHPRALRSQLEPQLEASSTGSCRCARSLFFFHILKEHRSWPRSRPSWGLTSHLVLFLLLPSSLHLLLLKIYLFIYLEVRSVHLHEWEKRQKERISRQTPAEQGAQAGTWLISHEIKTWANSKSPQLNQLRHPEASCFCVFLIVHLNALFYYKWLTIEGQDPPN